MDSCGFQIVSPKQYSSTFLPGMPKLALQADVVWFSIALFFN